MSSSRTAHSRLAGIDFPRKKRKLYAQDAESDARSAGPAGKSTQEKGRRCCVPRLPPSPGPSAADACGPPETRFPLVRRKRVYTVRDIKLPATLFKHARYILVSISRWAPVLSPLAIILPPTMIHLARADALGLFGTPMRITAHMRIISKAA